MKEPVVNAPLLIRSEPYQMTPTTPIEPIHSISGGSTDSVLATFIVIR